MRRMKLRFRVIFDLTVASRCFSNSSRKWVMAGSSSKSLKWLLTHSSTILVTCEKQKLRYLKEQESKRSSWFSILQRFVFKTVKPFRIQTALSSSLSSLEVFLESWVRSLFLTTILSRGYLRTQQLNKNKMLTHCLELYFSFI